MRNRHLISILLSLLAATPLLAQWQRAPKPQDLFDVKIVSASGANVSVGVVDNTLQTRGGIWRSADTAASWTRILSNTSVESALQNGARICAATTFKGILVSADSGLTWQQAVIQGGGQTYAALAQQGGVMLVGVVGGFPVSSGVLRSTDNGATWSPSATGFNGEGVIALAVYDSVILAGAFHYGSSVESGGVYRSTDGGLTWSRTDFKGTATSAFASNGSVFFAGTEKGVQRSTDLGLTWIQANTGVGSQSISSVLAAGSDVFAGTKGKGVFKSTNNGDQWIALNDSLTDLTIRSLATNGNILFAGTTGGLWRLTIHTPVLPPRDLTAEAGPYEVTLRWHGTGDFKSLKYLVYQGTAPGPTVVVDTVTSSTGNAFHHTVANLTLGVTYFFRIKALDSAGNQSDFSNEASATPFGFGFIAGVVSDSGVGLKGVTVKLLDTLSSPLADVLTDQDGRYLFSGLRGGVYDVAIVEPLGYSASVNPQRVTVNPPDTSRTDFVLTRFVTSSTARGVWYWKHQFDVYVCGAGTAQESVEALLKYIQNITVCYSPHFPEFQSATGLKDWQAILSPSLFGPIRTWAEAELGAMLLNLASLKFGQYTVATKDGRTVVDVAVYVSTLIMDADSTNDLFAAFLGLQCNMNWLINGGVIPKSDLVLGVGDTPDGNLPKIFSLMDNYPNPFNPETVISYGIPDAGGQASVVSLKVYDLLGREIATLVEGAQTPGTYRVTWNAAGLSSGVYLYRLEAGSFVQTRKMMLLK